MTKALTYFEIDVPDARTVIHLAFDPTAAEIASGSASVLDSNEAGTVRAWSGSGGVTFSANVAGIAFGSGVLHGDSTGWISTPDTSDLALSSGDFSFEFYFRKNTAVGTERNICGQRAGIGGANTTRAFNIDFDTAGHVRGLVYQGSTEIAATGTTVFGVTAIWHHVSFNRSGSSLLLFIDGVLEATTAITGAINDSTGTLAICQDGDDTANRLDGYIDEFTMCLYARHTANFTPETANDASGFVAPLFPPLRTIRFAIDTGYLPYDIDAIPSLKELQIDPAIISLGQDLGQRASVTATFRDHKHILNAESYSSGTFWGKFRAAFGLRLQGFPCRIITGTLGQALASMETRHFRIEATSGPTSKGEYKIVAKDLLKLADGDRAQAPELSSGFLSANITNVATSATLAPTGIGNAEYPTSGSVAIGGSEVCNFTRAGDVLTLTRAQFNTTGVAHNAQDRVQIVLIYSAANPATIIADLLETYASVPSQFINNAAWLLEISTYLSTVYSAVIAEPTSVETLVSELIEQVGLVMWWDDIGRQIRLQVLRPIASTADVYDGDNYMASSLEITEQPEKRLTQIYTYFAKINPLIAQDQENNFRSTALTVDSQAEATYGTSAIKKIFSRWIPVGGRAVATSLNDVLLARFSDPPRRIGFNVLRGSTSTPALGVGYQIGGWPFQAIDGSAVTVPAQITRLNPRADYFEVEVEEISANVISIGSPGVHDIIIDSNIFDVELRDMHDSIFGIPVSGNEVRCTINSGVIVGATNVAFAALNVGTWPVGVTVSVVVNGRLEGHGGFGGAGSATTTTTGAAGQGGGTALFTRKAISLTSASGQIWGGGGGGGGGGSAGNLGGGQPGIGGNGGSGGAGANPGEGAIGGGGSIVGVDGNDGSTEAGGAQNGAAGIGYGGAGGGPGLAGATGGTHASPTHTVGGLGGAAGSAIDGVSFVTTVGGAGDRRGGQIN